MKAVGWERLKVVFEAACGRPADERSRYLDEACQGDPALRAEAESLLSSHAAAGDFLETPPLVGAMSAMRFASEGRRIGPYRIVAKLGEGGQASVYRAVRDDDAFSKEVALKLIRDASVSELALERLRHEREILAGLEHPNIARLLDGGTTNDGLPWLAMELVEGERIDRYCEQRALTLRQRLELFRTVCAAVHFAHQNLVVHRDIKPANVLVTADGTPKLLDFGIARLLRRDADYPDPTVTDFRALTPQYASPEQLRSEPITTASDVYSLGVVLYELLTGRRPFDQCESREELARAICQDAPERPSASARGGPSPATGAPSTGGPTLGRTGPLPASGAEAPDAPRPVSSQSLKRARALEGDLDTIVLMALRKEPARRYSSPHELAEDLRRHLEGRPVRARPDTFGYRAGKFVRRKRVAVAATALVLVSLLGGLVAALWQARIADLERARAERRLGHLRAMASSFLLRFPAAIQDLPASSPARQLVVAEALRYLEILAPETGDDPDRMTEIADAYQRLGDAQDLASVGDSEGARRSYQRALALRAEALARKPDDAALQAATCVAAAQAGRVTPAPADAQAALGNLKAALAWCDTAPLSERPR